MTDTKPTLPELIEYMQSIVATSLLPTDMPRAILASLKELAALRLELGQITGEIPYGN